MFQYQSVKYVGEWAHDKCEGQGSLSSELGSYEGTWAKGRREGEGTLKGGDMYYRYTGGFRNDLRHGEGKYILDDKSTIDAYYTRDTKERPPLQEFPPCALPERVVFD